MELLKTLVKLAVAALVANAAFQLGSAYAGFYRFKDSVDSLGQYGAKRSEDDIRHRIVELASQADLPLDEDSLTIRRENSHTYIEGSYVKRIELMPGRPYPWTFPFKSDTFVVGPPER